MSNPGESQQMTNRQLEKARNMLDESHSNTRKSSVENANSGVAMHTRQEDIKPPSVEPGGKASNKSKVSRSVRKNIKSAMITFYKMDHMEDRACVQLLLCNISERALTFSLKCNIGKYLKAVPSASAHIPPKSQMRIMLTWAKPEQYESWTQVPPVKIMLVTTFLSDENSKQENDRTTKTRLAGRVSTTKRCNVSDAPIEQLLLDAVGRDSDDMVTAHNPTSVSQSTKSHSKENSERTTQSHTSIMSPATQARESLDRQQQGRASISDRTLLIAVLVILFFWVLIQSRKSNTPVIVEMINDDGVKNKIR